MSVAMQDNRRPDKICVIRRKTFSSDIGAHTTMKRSNLVAGAAGILAIGLAASASAAMIQYTPWQTFSSTDFIRTGAFNDVTQTVNQYNPADYGGSLLHNVELELAANGYVTYEVFNPSDDPIQYALAVDIEVSANDGPGGVIGDLIVSIPSIVDTQQTVGAGDTYQSPGWELGFADALTAADADAATYMGANLTPDIINFFTGTGSVDLNFSGRQTNNSEASGDVNEAIRSAYDFTGQIRYSYETTDDVPVPATLLLFGAGLAGIAATLRRRRKFT
jgi:hypothetical protein